MQVIPGMLVLTRASLHFFPTSEQLLAGARERRWELSKLAELLCRRYLLQLRALEFHFGVVGGGGGSSYFFSFEGSEERRAAQLAVLAQPLPSLLPQHSRKAEEAGALLRPDPAAWTRLWQLGALSNFDYLMRLNSLSGRTYSDLTQYNPQMPLPRHSTAFHGLPRPSTAFHGLPRHFSAFHGRSRPFTAFHGLRHPSTSFDILPRPSTIFHGLP